MDIKNYGNPKEDTVTVRESESNRKGQVWLGIGGTEHKPRHVNLRPAEARAVAYALLSYAEQVSEVSAGESETGMSSVETFRKL
jgi:hypothetical protein